MAMTLEDMESGVKSGSINIEDAVTEMAWRLNANEPESVKMGWPLKTCIEVAIERFNAQGVAVNGVGITELVRSRFVGGDNETGAILVADTGYPKGRVYSVYPWPGAGTITAEKSHTFLGRFRKGEVNWRSIGSVHPGRAEQYAKALLVAAQIASETAEEQDED